MRSYIIGSLVAVLVPSLVLAQGGAGETCDLTWQGPSSVAGYCRTGDGYYHLSIEDLNLCVGIDEYYYLVPQDK